MADTDALLFGRRTWRTMADAWPARAGDPFADRMNVIRKYVVSSTLAASDLDWENTALLGGDDVMADIEKLRRQDGSGLLIMGSASLASALIARDLVDECRLMIEPITLGGGKRLFPDDGRARPLTLVSSVTASTGVLVVTYRSGSAG